MKTVALVAHDKPKQDLIDWTNGASRSIMSPSVAWVQRFTPLLIDAAQPCRHVPGDRCRFFTPAGGAF
jgi:hypothetical protein